MSKTDGRTIVLWILKRVFMQWERDDFRNLETKSPGVVIKYIVDQIYIPDRI